MDRFSAIPMTIPKEIEKLILKCIGKYKNHNDKDLIY